MAHGLVLAVRGGVLDELSEAIESAQAMLAHARGMLGTGACRECDASITLYRAAKNDRVDAGHSFAETLETARTYLANPGFGGGHLYSASLKIADAEVIDLTGYTLEQLDAEHGPLSQSGAIGIDELLPRDVRICARLRDRGYLWAIVAESYPEDTRTWIWLGESWDGWDGRELVEIA